MLRRHLPVAHGLEVVDYRTRWKLPVDYPVTAPSYIIRLGARIIGRPEGLSGGISLAIRSLLDAGTGAYATLAASE